MWDDEVGLVQTTQMILTVWYNSEMTMAYFREYANDLGKQFGVELSSKKLENTKKKIEMEKNINY